MSKGQKEVWWAKQENYRIDCIWIDFKMIGPVFFKHILSCMKVSLRKLGIIF